MSTKKHSKAREIVSNDDDEIIASIELSDGNALRQTVEFFKNTVTMTPIVFYKDKMVIQHANVDASVINEAIFDRTDCIINYTVNTKLFNDQDNIELVKQKVKIIEKDKITYSEETIEVPCPRHIYVPISTVFYTQLKNISRKDGFRITIYKYSEDNQKNTKNKTRAYNMDTWVPDSYMKTTPLTGNTSFDNDVIVGSENTDENKKYEFLFENPINPVPNQVVPLDKLCLACTKLLRLHVNDAIFMAYPRGFRIKGEDGKGRDFKWGICKEQKVIKSKNKIVINDPDTVCNSFGIPSELLKPLSKLLTIAGNGGTAAIRSSIDAMEIRIPISTCATLKITIIPPSQCDSSDDEIEYEDE